MTPSDRWRPFFETGLPHPTPADFDETIYFADEEAQIGLALKGRNGSWNSATLYDLSGEELEENITLGNTDSIYNTGWKDFIETITPSKPFTIKARNIQSDDDNQPLRIQSDVKFAHGTVIDFANATIKNFPKLHDLEWAAENV